MESRRLGLGFLADKKQERYKGWPCISIAMICISHGLCGFLPRSETNLLVMSKGGKQENTWVASLYEGIILGHCAINIDAVGNH